MGKSTIQTTDVLETVRQLLAQGHAEQALEVLNGSSLASSQVENIRGVCMLRLGNIEQATKIFRHLVFQSNVGMDPNAPAEFKINYATALLLSGNLPGCNTVINEIYDKSHPGLAQLKEGIRKWKQSLSLGHRLTMLVGVQPSKPVTLDFPPGIV